MTWLVRTVLALAVVAGVLVAPQAPAQAADKVVTYTISSRGTVTGDLGLFASVAAATFADRRGWSLGGSIEFRRVSSGSSFDLILASPAVIAAASPGCSATYSCRVGRSVYINDDRWRLATSSWPYSLGEYRTYVILHEVGHWLGLFHTFENGCRSPGDGVPDTPYQHDGDNIVSCDESEDTCPARGLDPVHNFMSYGDDLCMDRFTIGQSVRMGLAWFVFRGDPAQLRPILR